jgi:hypothetical protein
LDGLWLFLGRDEKVGTKKGTFEERLENWNLFFLADCFFILESIGL